jgi:hypothetical protein
MIIELIIQGENFSINKSEYILREIFDFLIKN